MMKRAILSVMALGLATTMLLSGCKGNANKGSGDGSGGKVTEIVFQTWNPGEGDPIHEVIEKFEEQNKDIKVKYVFMPYTDHVEKLKIDMASGQAADVYGMQTGATIKEFRDFEMDLTPFAEKSWRKDWEKGYVPFCMDLLNENGKYYGLPLGLTYAGFAWSDNTILKKYDLEVPRSMDDLKKVTKVLRDKKEFPLTIGAKDAWINIDTWMSMANDINSKKLYDAIEGKVPLTDPDLVESFKIWQSCFKDGIFQDGALGVGVYNDTTDMFQKEGSIPLFLNGSWSCGVYVSTDPAEKKVFNSENSDHEPFLIDWNNDGKPCPISASVDVCLCMNKNTKHQEVAWRFIDFIDNPFKDVDGSVISLKDIKVKENAKYTVRYDNGKNIIIFENLDKVVLGYISAYAIHKLQLPSEKVKYAKLNISAYVTMAEKYTVSYNWGKDAPEGQNIPDDKTVYNTVAESKAAMDKNFTDKTTVEGTKNGKEGTWNFSGWAAAEADENYVVEFTGTWTFTEKVIPPVDPDDSGNVQSPETGYDGIVWLAFMFITGLDVLTATVCVRKKKN